MKNIATWIELGSNKHFDEIFGALPEFRLWNARAEELDWKSMDALLLTGGSDISAEFLRQEISDPTQIRKPDAARDKWEFDIIPQALQRGLPIFAICRGHQVLNIVLGGTLHLDIPGHNLPEQKYGDLQQLRFSPSATIRVPLVNSSHHQAIDKIGDGLEVEAWHVGDDIIEQVRLRDYPFCLAVQYHPERGEVYRPFFEAFFTQIRTS